ncbi:nitroreductase family protein [bacterium]|nr:MAG: nitroreductase family protein [bacterium]RIK61476.1 MAG: NADH oxidase [Planctomycetota bacterium]
MAGPEDYLELLRRRRSRREITPNPVEPEKLERALQAAMRAASGANAQPWEYVLIERGPLRERIRQMCEAADAEFHRRSPDWLKEFFSTHAITPVKQFTHNAPWLVAVFGRRDLPFWLQSVWLSIANFINALEAEGLHSLTYTPSLDRRFNALLGVDESWSLQALLPVGYGDEREKLEPRPRHSPAEKVRVIDASGKLAPFVQRLPFEP